MQKIKFRAWDESKKEMFVPQRIIYSSDEEIFLIDEKGVNRGSRCILLRWTGKKDREEVEIYEGDIMQLHCGSEDGVFNSSKVKGEVKWGEVGFHIAIPDKTVTAQGGSMKGKEVTWREMHTWVGGHTCLTQWQSKLHVKGNIYQHPELLLS